MKALALAIALLAVTSPVRAEDMAIPRETVQALINYLGTKPYQEVYQIIPVLMGLQPIKPSGAEKPEASTQQKDRTP